MGTFSFGSYILWIGKLRLKREELRFKVDLLVKRASLYFSKRMMLIILPYIFLVLEILVSVERNRPLDFRISQYMSTFTDYLT